MRRPNGAARLATARATRPNEMKPSVCPISRGNFQQRRSAFRPAAFAHHFVLLDQAAKTREQQHHGVIGDFLDEGVGNVGNRDAARGGGLDVDAVDTDAAERDDLAVFQPVDDLLRDRNALGVNRVGVCAAAINSSSSRSAPRRSRHRSESALLFRRHSRRRRS